MCILIGYVFQIELILIHFSVGAVEYIRYHIVLVGYVFRHSRRQNRSVVHFLIPPDLSSELPYQFISGRKIVTAQEHDKLVSSHSEYGAVTENITQKFS